MQIVSTILITLGIILVGAAAFGHASVGGVYTFPAGVALWLLSLLAVRFNLP